MDNVVPKPSLLDMYRSASQCVVAFINKMAKVPADQQPIFPGIIGTGFLVNSKGLAVTNRHVVEEMERLPPHPITKQSTAGAFLIRFDEEGKGCQALLPSILGFGSVDSFTSSDSSDGQAVPDIGFVQLGVRETPFLRLNTEDWAIQPGMEISTIGYPMGTVPLTLYKKVRQMSPFIRRGIVSSVYPCPAANPRGFSIDIMQQGGSSGSPIFGPDNRRVVGMMWSGLNDPRPLVIASMRGHVALPTNISLAEPAHIVAGVLAEVAKHSTVSVKEIPTLKEIQEASPRSDVSQGLEWEVFQAT